MNLINENKERICNLRFEKDEIINNISKFIASLNLDNIHEEFYVFCYLLWNGYFSVNKEFSYGREYGRELSSRNNEEYSVFLGKSKSTGVSNLLTKVLENNSYFAEIAALSIQKVELNNTMNIRRNFSEQMKDFTQYRKYLNQRVTYVSNIGKELSSFIFDPVLLTECEVLDKGRLNCINGKYKINKKQFQRVLDKPFFYSENLNKESVIDNNEILDSYIKMNDFCFDNKNKFDDFYLENSKHYEKIKRLV